MIGFDYTSKPVRFYYVKRGKCITKFDDFKSTWTYWKIQIGSKLIFGERGEPARLREDSRSLNYNPF
jgi:hypothetical protein